MKLDTPKSDVLEELRAIHEKRRQELEEQLKQFEKHSYAYSDVQSRLIEINQLIIQVQLLIIKNIGE